MLFIVVFRNNRMGRSLKKPRNSILIGATSGKKLLSGTRAAKGKLLLSLPPPITDLGGLVP